MKKFIYLFMALGLVITTACDPMEDIYDDFDQLPSKNNSIVGDAIYTLTEEDYTLEKDEGGFLELNFPNFNSIDDAKTLIPDFLDGTYPVWGVTYKDDGSINLASSAEITFKWYSPIGSYSADVYALSDDEHNAITGNTYGNFDDEDHVFEYLEATYPSPADGDFVSLKYRYYDGGESTLTDGFAFEDGDWVKFTGFTPDQYEAMGEGFPNFSSHDEANVKIPIALIDVFKFEPKEAGDIVLAMYELYKGGGVTGSYTSNYVFDGVSFSKYENEAVETIKFGHDGDVWVPDNTIKYTLTGADFTLIGNALVDKYDGPGWSAANYGNFDRREGNENYWSNEMILEGLNIFLNDTDSGAADGQKYVISYAIYNGAAGVESMSVIKADGVWINQE